MEAYRLANADAIAAADARRAEEVRREAALELSRGDPGTGQGAVSGTAAAFEGGRDAEPHQGMDYTATLPAGLLNHECVGGSSTVSLPSFGGMVDLIGWCEQRSCVKGFTATPIVGADAPFAKLQTILTASFPSPPASAPTRPGQPPPATAAGPLPDMLGMLRDGDISHADARTPMDKAAWQAMASASGWTPGQRGTHSSRQ